MEIYFSDGHSFFVLLVLKTMTHVLSLLEVIASGSGGAIMTENQKKLIQTLYLIFDYPYKYYTFKLFEV